MSNPKFPVIAGALPVPAKTQVLVIGGGPAGSVAAAFLAKNGMEVTLLEREQHPRYHIGESLLPSCLDILQILGCDKVIDNYGFNRKGGGLFSWKGEKWYFDFGIIPQGHNYTHQVPRDEYDYLLLKNAKDVGVRVIELTSVQSINWEGEGEEKTPKSAVWQRGKKDEAGYETGEIAFDYLIDASGRAGIVCNRYYKSRVFNNNFKNIATWGYWKNADPVKAEKFFNTATHITNPLLVDSFYAGWMWGIPLHDGTLSVGVVMKHDAFMSEREKGESKEEMYHRIIKSSEIFKVVLEGAEMVPGDLRTEGDYSYHSSVVAGNRFWVCGDAACFLDPLLSSGTHLAMFSATMASASLLSLHRGEITQAEATRFYTKAYLQHFMRWVVIVSSVVVMWKAEAYFFTTQNLVSSNLVQEPTLKHYWTRMVSGNEDLKDSTDTQLLEQFVKKLESAIKTDGKDKPFLLIPKANAMIDESMGFDPTLKRTAFQDGSFDGLELTLFPKLGVVKKK